jgi:Zn finger protein HypA/HybF involved in hydrogenase expression
MFQPIHATVVYCVLVGAVFFMLWLCSDRRDRANFEGVLRRGAFHCIRCDQIYSANAVASVAPCPRCGHENPRLRF